MVLTTLSFVSVALPAWGRTITVDLNGGGDFTGIQPAIDGAQDGDAILVHTGEYVVTESVTVRGEAITMRASTGPEETTIRLSETSVDPGPSHRGAVTVVTAASPGAPPFRR